MKSLVIGFLLLCSTASAWAVPDPQDSIILESKIVAPSNGPVAATMRVWITNKDSLSTVVLVLEEKSAAGGAYMVLANPRTFNGVVTPLTTTLQFYNPVNFNFYHSDSPDSFLIVGLYDPRDSATWEPPNPVRKPFWEIKFDSVRTLELGAVEFDSTRIFSNRCQFVNVGLQPVDIDVNFLKSSITVAPKGDMNADGFLTPTDVVVLMNCIFRGMTPPPGEAACDLNCDSEKGVSDVVLLLNAAFMGEGFPC